MNAKTTTVTLVSNGVTREFEYSHAERLLRYPNSGWELLANSKYEFVNDALRRKQDKKGVDGKQ